MAWPIWQKTTKNLLQIYFLELRRVLGLRTKIAELTNQSSKPSLGKVIRQIFRFHFHQKNVVARFCTLFCSKNFFFWKFRFFHFFSLLSTVKKILRTMFKKATFSVKSRFCREWWLPSNLPDSFGSMQKWLWTNCKSRAGSAGSQGTQPPPARLAKSKKGVKSK